MGRRKQRSDELRASGFFVLRTPLLPFGELAAWAAELEAPGRVGDPAALAAALERDQVRLRERLAELTARSEFRDAVFVASPTLDGAVELWRRQPENDRARKMEPALVAYFSRAAARPTPFGLFAGCTTGAIGEMTSLRLPGGDGYRRHSRLDMEYLCALAEAIERDPALRAELIYRPNSSLYEAGGRLHFVEAHQGPGGRAYKLVAVDNTPYLAATLERAQPGARLHALAAALVDEEVTQAEAEEYVGELVDSQILTGDAQPPVTGEQPLEALVRTLSDRGSTAPVAERLRRAMGELASIDGDGLEIAREQYEAVAEMLAGLPAEPQLSRLVQVDLTKPAPALTLGTNVVDEVTGAVRTLHKLAVVPRRDALARFREEFTRRYETRELPLVEVLDEEHGIGFERLDSGAAQATPLLGLPVEQHADEAGGPSRRDGLLLRKFAEAVASGADEIVLGADELAALELPEPPPLPDGFEVVAALEASSTRALDEGDFRVFVQSVSGPPGARLLARFCHADERLHELVRQQLRAEEENYPDRVVAEIVHLPEDRVGNILSRPVLRGYEIPYLGKSAAPPERQLPVTDLLVSVVDERIALRSRRLGREVVPRLTTAHNYARRSLAVYRFLCALQNQGVVSALMWNWGPLAQAPFLPRVVSGRAVLARARWNLDAREVATLAGQADAEQFAAVQALRRARRLPRWVALADGDNELVVDFENVLSLGALARELTNRSAAALVELFPAPERLCVEGPDGRFMHQLVIPFVRESPAPPPAPARPSVTVRRRFPPGSDWLYLKLFSGTASTDLVLHQLARGVEASLSSGAADGWFFIRYGDPDWHLRLRIHGASARLLGETLPMLHALAEPLLDSGRLWRVQLDTYEREVERYGGGRGVEIAEAIFRADSDAVLPIIRAAGADEPDLRWRAAFAGIYLLFDDFELTLDDKRMIARRACSGYGQELGVTKDFQREMSRRFRRERSDLEPLVHGDRAPAQTAADAVLGPLRRRSAAVRPLAAELRELAEAGQLTQPLPDLAMSYAHMHVNRMLRTAQRAHELVLYEMLSRVYSSEAALR